MYYPIKLDKDRNLRYGMKSLMAIEKSLKKPIGAIDFKNMSIADLAVFIWGGLIHEEKTLTVEKVVDLIDDHSNIKDVMAAVGSAFNQTFGGDEANDAAQAEGDEKNA